MSEVYWLVLALATMTAGGAGYALSRIFGTRPQASTRSRDSEIENLTRDTSTVLSDALKSLANYSDAKGASMYDADGLLVQSTDSADPRLEALVGLVHQTLTQAESLTTMKAPEVVALEDALWGQVRIRRFVRDASDHLVVSHGPNLRAVPELEQAASLAFERDIEQLPRVL